MSADDPKVLKAFIAKNRSKIAEVQDGDRVYLAESQFSLRWAADKNPEIKFTDVKDLRVG